MRLVSGDVPSTAAIAAALAKQCRPGDCILLRGELGAGKTSFARGFIRALSGNSEEIVSPTFTLVQTYPAPVATLWHFDLYRLKTPEELAEIGLDEALEAGISLIEWPELAENALPALALDVTIIHGNTPEQRLITLSGEQAAWGARLAVLKEYE